MTEGGTVSKASTWGKKESPAEGRPDVPDITQLCPSWLERQSKRPHVKSGLNDPEFDSYPQAYEVQKTHIPDYKWPQSRATKSTYQNMLFAKHNIHSNDKKTQGQVLAMDIAILIQHTLGHEVRYVIQQFIFPSATNSISSYSILDISRVSLAVKL